MLDGLRWLQPADSADPADGLLALARSRHAAAEVALHDRDGTPRAAVPLPGLGSLAGLTIGRPGQHRSSRAGCGSAGPTSSRRSRCAASTWPAARRSWRGRPGRGRRCRPCCIEQRDVHLRRRHHRPDVRRRPADGRGAPPGPALPATAASASTPTPPTAPPRWPGSEPAASTRWPRCAAAARRARRGTARATAATSRTCSTTSTPPRRPWSTPGDTTRRPAGDPRRLQRRPARRRGPDPAARALPGRGLLGAAARHGPLRAVLARAHLERRVRHGRRPGRAGLAAVLLPVPPRARRDRVPGRAVHRLRLRHPRRPAARPQDVRGPAARHRR